jgi:hypothetical protein
MSRPKARKQDTPKAFDLASRYQAETVTVHILDPVDNTVDTGMRVEIASLYSPEAHEAALRPALVLEGNTVQPVAARDRWLEQTIAVTKRWWQVDVSDDAIMVGGTLLPCTPENVRALYTDLRTRWFQKQVQAKYLTVEDFFGGPEAA